MNYNLNSDVNLMSRNGHRIKRFNNLKYIGSTRVSNENDIQIRISQALSELNSMKIIWKSKMSNNLKRNFFRSAIESILLYGSITCILIHILAFLELR